MVLPHLLPLAIVEVSDGEETGEAGGEEEAPARERWVTRRAGAAEQGGEEAVPGGGLDAGPYLAEVFEQGGVQQRGDPGDSPRRLMGQGGRWGWGPLTYERFDCAVDVFVLLEARRGGERLPAVRAGVGAGSHVLGADVALQVAGVGKHLRGQTSGSLPCRPSPAGWGSHCC